MSKFIKLTGVISGERIYLNMDHIVSFYKVEKGTHVAITLYTIKKIPQDQGYLVKESPEAIMSIIESN